MINFLSIIFDEVGNLKGVRMIGYIGEEILVMEIVSVVWRFWGYVYSDNYIDERGKVMN